MTLSHTILDMRQLGLRARQVANVLVSIYTNAQTLALIYMEPQLGGGDQENGFCTEATKKHTHAPFRLKNGL